MIHPSTSWRARARSRARASFSIVDRGSESTNSTRTGTLNEARLRRACASTSSTDSAAPATGTTKATPRSPQTGSGTPQRRMPR